MVLKRPTVSIGIPVYNGGRFLGAAIEAFLGQTFADLDVVVCDNASTDDTEAVARTYAARDPRVRYVRHRRNLGAAANYRSAFEHAAGRYFKWAACDDLPGATLIERSVEVLDREPEAVLAYPRTQLIDEQGRSLGPFEDNLDLRDASAVARVIQVFERVGRCNAIYGLMRPEVLRRTRLLGPYIASDKACLLELALYGQFHEIPEVLFFRRIHDGAYGSQSDPSVLNAFYNPGRPSHVASFRWRHLRENAAAILRSPLAASDKLRLLAYLARMGVWQRDVLIREFGAAVRQLAIRDVGGFVR